MLRIIEGTLPVQRIWLDAAEAREAPLAPSSREISEELRLVLDVLYRNLVRRKGLSPAFAREQLLRTEPFHNFPDLVAALPDPAQ
jgi:hypothetical protein